MRAQADVIGLILNVERPDAAAAGRAILEACRAMGVRVLVEARSAPLVGVRGMRLSALAARTRYLVVVGGDGTLLAVVPDAARHGCAVLGINAGSLGFLTTVPIERAAAAVRDFVRGRCVASERVLLEAALVRKGRAPRRLGVALNDAVVTRSRGALIAHFAVRVDGELVTEYAADGVIVATPTGSTAYSLSAGGAVLVPEAPVLSLTPICPHALTNRPVIISDRAVIGVEALRGDGLRVALDGRREAMIPPGTVLELRRSVSTLALAMPGPHRFFGVLRQKLRWSGTNV